jgi:hypothetical protein
VRDWTNLPTTPCGRCGREAVGLLTSPGMFTCSACHAITYASPVAAAHDDTSARADDDSSPPLSLF